METITAQNMEAIDKMDELIKGFRYRLSMPCGTPAEARKLKSDSLIWLAHIERQFGSIVHVE